MAVECGQEVWAMVIGEDNKKCIEEAAAYGADKVVSVEGLNLHTMAPKLIPRLSSN